MHGEFFVFCVIRSGIMLRYMCIHVYVYVCICMFAHKYKHVISHMHNTDHSFCYACTRCHDTAKHVYIHINIPHTRTHTHSHTHTHQQLLSCMHMLLSDCPTEMLQAASAKLPSAPPTLLSKLCTHFSANTDDAHTAMTALVTKMDELIASGKLHGNKTAASSTSDVLQARGLFSHAHIRENMPGIEELTREVHVNLREMDGTILLDKPSLVSTNGSSGLPPAVLREASSSPKQAQTTGQTPTTPPRTSAGNTPVVPAISSSSPCVPTSLANNVFRTPERPTHAARPHLREFACVCMCTCACW
jgi:hypothetical protein